MAKLEKTNDDKLQNVSGGNDPYKEYIPAVITCENDCKEVTMSYTNIYVAADKLDWIIAKWGSVCPKCGGKLIIKAL